VNARTLRAPERFAGAIDILEAGARKSADHGVLYARGDFAHGLEISHRGNRKARLDDVDAHRVEKFRYFDFFLESHGGARRLFAVTQCRIEDDDPLSFVAGTHGFAFLRLLLRRFHLSFGSFP